MFQPSGTGGFQRGYPSWGIPPFNPGVPTPRMGDDNTTWQSNQRVYWNFNCVPLINIASNSRYLEKNYVFAWSTEDLSEVTKESVDNIFNQYHASGPLIDNQVHTHGNYGNSHIPIITAVNLPIVNYLLMKMCNDVVPGEIDKKFAGCKEIEPWIIPPIAEVVKRVWPIGPNVTTKEAAEYGYTVRNVALTGFGDTRSLWGCCNWDGKFHNKFEMIPTGSRAGFMCYPVLASKYKNSENFNYTIDEQVTVGVYNTKEVFWKIVPVLCGDGEHMKSMEAEYTIVKHFGINTPESFECDDGEIHDKVLTTLIYKPYIWKVGKIGGPASGPMTNATGGQHDKFRIETDPTVDYNTLVKLPVFEMHADILGPAYKSPNHTFNARSVLSPDERDLNRYHHHLLTKTGTL